jgi:hypothetical protein
MGGPRKKKSTAKTAETKDYEACRLPDLKLSL